MLNDAFDFLTQAFTAAVYFFERIVSSIGGGFLIVTMLGTVFVVSMFLMPLRGAAISSFAESSLNHIKAAGKTKYKRGTNNPGGATRRLKGK